MSTKNFWISIIGIILSFIGGFLFANSLNRNEMSKLQAENEQFKKTNPQSVQNNNEEDLSDEEIRQKIVQADNTPTDIAFQRNLGLALYSYGAMKQNPELIKESTRLLQRANTANPKDYEVLVILGHAFFDMAAMRKENQDYYKQARDYYQKALEQKPDDSNVRADFGSTFLLIEPGDLGKALAELQKALQLNPQNERALQFLTQVYLKQQNNAEAQKTLTKLKETNANNPMIPSLTAQITQGKSN